MRPSRSIARTVLTGLILSAVPVLSLASQSLNTPNTTTLLLPATIEYQDGGMQARSNLNTLDLSQMAGDNNMAVGDVVYVHIETSGAKISYPFAISQNRPDNSGVNSDANNDSHTITLRGIVTDRVDDRLYIRYLFEALPKHAELSRALAQIEKTHEEKREKKAGSKVELELSVNRRAVARVTAVRLDGKLYPL